jgi:hypothetical protein
MPFRLSLRRLSLVTLSVLAVAATWAPPVTARPAMAPATGITNLSITRELRSEFAHAVRDKAHGRVVGPLTRRCVARSQPPRRSCQRYKHYKIFASESRTGQWGRATFIINGKTKVIEFVHYPGEMWQAKLGSNSLPPVPCEVRKHWGLDC